MTEQQGAEPEVVAGLQADVELLAQQVARLQRELRLVNDGVRADFQATLLEQLAKVERRFLRLEALFASGALSELPVHETPLAQQH